MRKMTCVLTSRKIRVWGNWISHNRKMGELRGCNSSRTDLEHRISECCKSDSKWCLFIWHFRGLCQCVSDTESCIIYRT